MRELDEPDSVPEEHCEPLRPARRTRCSFLAVPFLDVFSKMLRVDSFDLSLYAPLLLGLLLLTAGCDEATLGPEARGDITGQVLDADSNAPVEQASITTSPPTQSVLTDENGEFTLTGVETGNYTVDVTKKNYDSQAVSVRVREGEVAQAIALLETSDDAGEKRDSLSAAVVDFYNDRINRDSTGADSVFVTAQYRAQNVGDRTITAYELYFRIETDAQTFSEEVTGDTLDAGQADLGDLRTYVRSSDAERVEITDVYVETE